MQAVLGLFLIVVSACAIAQQVGTASISPVLPDAVERPSPEPSSPETATSATGAASLPNAPSYTIQQPPINASTLQSEHTLPVTTISLTMGSGTTVISPLPKRYVGLAMPNSPGNSSLIFVGGTSAGTDAADPHQQLDGSMSGSGKNCSRGPIDKNDRSSWTTSLLSITSKGERYCVLGEGGFWKRGTYAASHAFAAHGYDSASSFSTADAFGLGIVPGVPARYYPYQNYTGERLAARYASAVGRDALRNMFREFWPDISAHLLHHHP